MLISFRMTGQLLYMDENFLIPCDKHTHIVFKLNSGAQLRFRDVRKFGSISLIKTSEIENAKEILKLGYEPFSNEITKDKLYQFLKSKNGKIKQVLMNQSFICGIGNIYSDEILFYAGIHPERITSSLSFDEVCTLHDGIVKVLSEAIEYNGTSIRDYVDGEGEKGGYQHRLKVYGRKEKKCARCDSVIACTKIGGRTAHFCPHCQK